MRHLAKALMVFGSIWGVGLALLMLVGNLLYLYNATSKWDAIKRIQWEYSPFNLLGWLSNLIFISPAIASILLAQWLRGRPR